MDVRKITKVKTALEDMFYNGNLKRYHMTPMEAQVTWDVFARLLKEEDSTTIFERVKDFYIKYGFNVQEDGIGWIIKLK